MNITKQTARALSAATLALAANAAMAADVTAFDSVITAGNQSYGQALGMDFNVLSAITVTKLGAFDSGQDGFAVGTTIQVAIFDRNTQAIVSPIASFTNATPGTLSGNQSFIDIADITLAAGQYSVVAVGFNANDKNGNYNFIPNTGPTMNTGGGLISFSGSGATARYGGAGLVFPTLTAGVVQTNQFDAGTFQFTNAVPEPSAYAMALLALAGLGFTARRRKA
jgi:PEP-CTERM motif